MDSPLRNMNREIKFRCWDTVSKLWVGGWKITQSGVKSYEKGYVWMQFTGLLDRNGKDIYEGDICKMKFGGIGDEFIISIRWDFSGANWQFDDHTSFDDGVGLGNFDFNCGIANDSEIIGNIYENPNLTN